MIKLFVIGNELLADDGIAIKVIKNIENKIPSKMKIYYCGLDDMYFLENVEEYDSIILIDSTFFNIKPGTVQLFTKETLIRNNIQIPILNIIFCLYKYINLYFIGIEISSLVYSNSSSEEINNKFDIISNEVLYNLKKIDYSII